MTFARRGGVRAIAGALGMALFGASPVCAAPAEDAAGVLEALNESLSVGGSTKESKSYPILFDAFLALGAPPMALGAEFNHTTIHPGMPRWSEVAGWAESNEKMATAIRSASEKTFFGLPYGLDAVEANYREKNLVAEVGADGSLRNIRFPYLDAIDAIAAYAVAESYRLLEAGEIDKGLDLAAATLFVLRQCCDREFLEEQYYAIILLTQALSNLRDMLWVYLDKIEWEKFSEIGLERLPFLRPDRGRLFMPEGDMLVSAALIAEVFDARGQADVEKFGSTFAELQSASAPLTRWGALKRWMAIATVHDSEEASLKRLQLVYDDWYRRWRVQEYDPILDIPTQFERTNPVRYAAVIYSMRDIEGLFVARNALLASVYGTAMAAGVAGYKRQHGTYPRDSEMAYATYVRKRSDTDPFDRQFLPFEYRVLDADFSIDTSAGRVRVDKGVGLLYSRGQNNQDDRGAQHTDNGAEGDIVLWPPIRSLEREQKLVK